VAISGRDAPHPNPGQGGHRSRVVAAPRITVAHVPAARQQPPGRIHEVALTRANRKGRRLPAAALPRNPGKVRHPRLGAAGGERARDQLAARKRVLAQRRDHRRLGRRLCRLQPAIAVAEALARRC
jgi:hypothetical protein